jgi:cobalt-zinc-cadmium efflux system protein
MDGMMDDVMNKVQPNLNNKAVSFALILNSAFTVFQIAVGILAGSLALLADAMHNFVDILTLTISFIANKLSFKRGNHQHTFGFGRATILAAQFNSLIMLGIASYIVFEAIGRLLSPSEVNGIWVIIVGAMGFVINGMNALKLRKHQSDLNMRSAYIDMLFDALGSLGASVGGILITFTGMRAIDPIIALAIAGFLIFNAQRILREAISILLEGTPQGVNFEQISEAILEDKRIILTDDIHIWALRSNFNFLACHIVLDKADFQVQREIVAGVKARCQALGIQHTTIEVEDLAAHQKYQHTH